MTFNVISTKFGNLTGVIYAELARGSLKLSV